MTSSTDSFTIAPGGWLGLLGGGQLGRMFCHAAQSLGYRVAVLDPAADGPAAMVADRHIQAAYDDPAGLAQLAQIRSEEHTSELQSLMRISYAVFCLNKKN